MILLPLHDVVELKDTEQRQCLICQNSYTYNGPMPFLKKYIIAFCLSSVVTFSLLMGHVSPQ